MRVVVTGGCGKVGRAVVDLLHAAACPGGPHAVTVLDAVDAPEQAGDVRYLKGDVTDLGQLCGVLRGADAVVHLAAVPRFGIVPDEATFRTNVLGTFNVHEAASLVGVRRVVSASSDAVLGWNYRIRDFLPRYLPIDEDHPATPQDAYGLSKAAGEAVARSYADRGALETVVLRPPGVKSAEQVAEMRRSGGVRPNRFDLLSYVDVTDLAEAFALALQCAVDGHVVLFTPADDSTVAEPLADLLPRLDPALAPLAGGLTGSRAMVSNARARSVLGWQPRRSWRSPAYGA